MEESFVSTPRLFLLTHYHVFPSLLHFKICHVPTCRAKMPAQFPTALLRAKDWYSLPSLAARVEADAATLVTRCWNGAGHPVFANAMEFLLAATLHHLKIPFNPLSAPRHAHARLHIQRASRAPGFLHHVSLPLPRRGIRIDQAATATRAPAENIFSALKFTFTPRQRETLYKKGLWRVRDFVEWFDGRLVRNNTGGHQAQVRVDIVESLVNGGHIQFDDSKQPDVGHNQLQHSWTALGDSIHRRVSLGQHREEREDCHRIRWGIQVWPARWQGVLWIQSRNAYLVYPRRSNGNCDRTR